MHTAEKARILTLLREFGPRSRASIEALCHLASLSKDVTIAALKGLVDNGFVSESIDKNTGLPMYSISQNGQDWSEKK
jgi:hypothetical protein